MTFCRIVIILQAHLTEVMLMNKVTRIQLGDCEIDLLKGTIFRNGVQTRLDHMPLKLLTYLIQNPAREISKDELLENVWQKKVVSEEVLSVAVSQIRRELGDNAKSPTYIKTISGTGYCLIAQVKKCRNSRLSYLQYFNKTMTVFGGLALFVLIGLWLNHESNDAALNQQLTATQLEQYKKGRYLLTRENPQEWRQAQRIFEKLIDESIEYAPLYLNLAASKFKLTSSSSFSNIEEFAEIKRLIQRSLKLEPAQAKAHLLMANHAFLNLWDIKNARLHFEKSLNLDDSIGDTHSAYAQFLLAQAEYSQAIAHVERYVELRPEGLASATVAWIYNMMGDYPNALRELEKLKGLNPDALMYHVSAQAILENMGREFESFQAMLKVFNHFNYTSQEIMQAQQQFDRGGLAAVYLWLLDVKKESRNIGQYEPPLSFARYAVKSGQLVRAQRYLELALQKRQVELLWLAIDPKYQAIKSMPIFAKIQLTIKAQK